MTSDAAAHAERFSSPELSELARALSSRVRRMIDKGGDPTSVVYLSCAFRADPVTLRKSRAEAGLVPTDSSVCPAGTVFWSGHFAKVTLGTYVSPAGERMVEYVEVSAGAHGKIIRVSEAEFAAAHLRWTSTGVQGNLPEDHPSRREVWY